MKIHNAHGKKTMNQSTQQTIPFPQQQQQQQGVDPAAMIMGQLNNMITTLVGIDHTVTGLNTTVSGLSVTVTGLNTTMAGLSAKVDKTDAALSAVIDELPGDFEKWGLRVGAAAGVIGLGIVIYEKASAS